MYLRGDLVARVKFEALSRTLSSTSFTRAPMFFFRGLSLTERVYIFLFQLSQYGGCVLEAGDGSDRESRLCLHLGLTDYRCDLSAPLLNVCFLFSMGSDIDRMITIL